MAIRTWELLLVCSLQGKQRHDGRHQPIEQTPADQSGQFWLRWNKRSQGRHHAASFCVQGQG